MVRSVLLASTLALMTANVALGCESGRPRGRTQPHEWRGERRRPVLRQFSRSASRRPVRAQSGSGRTARASRS